MVGNEREKMHRQLFLNNHTSICVAFIFTGIILFVCVCGCVSVMCMCVCSVFIKRKWNTPKKYISYINMNLFFALLATKSKVCKGMTNTKIFLFGVENVTQMYSYLFKIIYQNYKMLSFTFNCKFLIKMYVIYLTMCCDDNETTITLSLLEYYSKLLSFKIYKNVIIY